MQQDTAPTEEPVPEENKDNSDASPAEETDIEIVKRDSGRAADGAAFSHSRLNGPAGGGAEEVTPLKMMQSRA